MLLLASRLRPACAPHTSRPFRTQPCVTAACRNAHASSSSSLARPHPTARPFSTAPATGRSLLQNDSGAELRRDQPLRTHACAPLLSRRPARLPTPGSARIPRRAFHSTARRDALPIVPALGVLFKGTTVLGLATGLSRILISFFPIGTLATLRLARGVTRLEADARVPAASHDAVEFWRTWCADERPVRVAPQEAAFLVNSPQDAHGGYVLPNGRVAYAAPLPRSGSGSGAGAATPRPTDGHADRLRAWRREEEARLRRGGFFVPPLPPASRRSYEDLAPDEQAQVHALRRYYLSLRLFKDRLRSARLVVAALLGFPVLLLCAVWLSALERVPLTGRWRLILLTPEDEETVQRSLAGPAWFRSVIALLTTPEAPAPPVLPLADWRWGWAQRTLRHLEHACVAEVFRVAQGAAGAPAGKERSWPPPPEYPLLPRARASARLHAALPGGDRAGQEHMELGPPYSLMLLESGERNAFSYGFGADGAGGIVLYSGLLDAILAHGQGARPVPPPPAPRSWLARLFLPAPPAPAPPPPAPTREQDLHLATVLAHEMAHLLLSHHLETLSHQQVLWPSVLGLSVDMLRAFIWPFTIFLGPAVNDALASVGRTTAEEMGKVQLVGFDKEHEYEADLLALRLLAIAGYDPKEAVADFAGSIAQLDEMQAAEKQKSWWSLFKLWNNSHPSVSERVDAMRKELDKWDAYRREHGVADVNATPA